MRPDGKEKGRPPAKARRREVGWAERDGNGGCPGRRGARALAARIVEDGGAALAVYREPFGGTPAVLAALPIDRSRADALPARSVGAARQAADERDRDARPLSRSDHRVRRDDGYWTPNGNHRLQAMRKLGAKAVIALVVPDPDVAFKILALNTEKAHNLKEKSLETIRMLRALADERGAAIRARVRVRVRAAGVSHARRRLRAAAAAERRRLQFGAAADRRLSRRAIAARAQGAHAARRAHPGHRRRGRPRSSTS